MFTRQLKLLLQDGVDIVSALVMISNQINNRQLQKILNEIIDNIRGGASFSSALSKHPDTFSKVYVQAVTAGEKQGTLDFTLEQMIQYLERRITGGKKLTNALTYPIILLVVAIVVIRLLAIFVLPVFVNLYSAMNSQLPLATRIVMAVANWIGHFGVYVIGVLLFVIALGFIYTRTSAGKLRWDNLLLHLPVIGRINLLNELSRSCWIIALLYKVGIPVPEILDQAVKSSQNQVYANALAQIQKAVINGGSLAKPMSQNRLFLPLVLQMTKVGEESGNLEYAMTLSARSYETESAERIDRAVASIQLALTIIIALIVAFIAISLVSAMYGIYGQVNL